MLRACQALRLLIGLPSRIDQERAIEVRALIDGPAAVVVDAAAPGQNAAFGVAGAEFEPDVEAIDGPPGKKWPILRVRTTASTRTRAAGLKADARRIERRGDLADLADG